MVMRDELGKVSESGPFGHPTRPDGMKAVPDCSQNGIKREGDINEDRRTNQQYYDARPGLGRLGFRRGNMIVAVVRFCTGRSSLHVPDAPRRAAVSFCG